MNYYPSPIINLIRNIAKLPGIGEKTAERLAMHILSSPRAEAERLCSSIQDVINRVRLCATCFALSDREFCGICSNSSRNTSLLCVVERQADMVAIEKSGSFNGHYHILSGVLSPMDGVGPDDIKIKELVFRIKKGGIQEVVIATSTNVEGEATASYLSDILKVFAIKITRIASGVPIGGDLKYVDQVTLKRAMDTRHPVEYSG